MSTGRHGQLSWLGYVREILRCLERLRHVGVVVCLLVGAIPSLSTAQTRDVGHGHVRPMLDRLVRAASSHPADWIWGVVADLAYRAGDVEAARSALARYPSIDTAVRYRDIVGMRITLRLKGDMDCSHDEFPARQLALVEIGEPASAWERLESCPRVGAESWGWLALAYARNAEFAWSLRAIEKLPASEALLSADAGGDFVQRTNDRYGRGVGQRDAATYPVHRYAARAMIAYYAVLAGDRSVVEATLASIDVDFWRAAAIAGMVVASLQVGDVGYAADILEAAEIDSNLPKEIFGARPMSWMDFARAPSWLERPQREASMAHGLSSLGSGLEEELWIGRGPIVDYTWLPFDQFFSSALMEHVSALRWDVGMSRLLEVLKRGAWGRSLEFDTINVWIRRFDEARRISEQVRTMRSSGYTPADLYLGLLARAGAYEEALAFAKTG